MDNPLLNHRQLPAFSSIQPEHVEPAIDHVLDESQKIIDSLTAQSAPYTWQNLVQPLEDIDDRIERTWSPVSHLNAVMNSPQLRSAYENCLPKLTAFNTALGQNTALYNAIKSLKDSAEYATLDQAQKQIIENNLRDFHLSGVDLPEKDKQRFGEIKQELSDLSSKIANNVLDATNAWHLHFETADALNGLTESGLALAKQLAQARELEGYVITLDFPSYLSVMTYAEDRTLREKVYHAFVTRASSLSDHPELDNRPLIGRTLALRHEMAGLLGFKQYSEYSLARKMADTPEEVMHFLYDLAERSHGFARDEIAELRAYASRMDQLDELATWDLFYYSEKLKQEKFRFSKEELKPYFPVTRVIDGLFAIVERLYGLQILQVENTDTWHNDVRFYEIRDRENKIRGQFYLDLYARQNKRGGAWMADCICRRKINDTIQTPAAFLTCNFTPPIGDDPALLTHDEVVTLFHEFGHGLHHMLTKVDHLGVSGIRGVAWDAVELPSQFMENWCWQKDSLDLIARHYKSGEPLPEELFERLLEAKNFQSAMQMVRQLEFAIFDFRLHNEYNPDAPVDMEVLLNDVRSRVAVILPPGYNRFANSFTHIFAGGYAAGYYSYKWAEVLSADAFSAFEETSLFDQNTGERFLQEILEKGGSEEPMKLFVAFRGRKPSIEPLLRHSGLAA